MEKLTHVTYAKDVSGGLIGDVREFSETLSREPSYIPLWLSHTHVDPDQYLKQWYDMEFKINQK